MNKFKITMPILKTRVKIVKDEAGKDKEIRFIEGVASNTSLDLHGDRMGASALKTMADSLKLHNIPMNDDHNKGWSSEFGDVTKLFVNDDEELVLEAELSEMSKAKDLWYALTEKNKKLGLSIGGYVKDYELVQEESDNKDEEPKWVRVYKDIELDHIAVTKSPANPKTWVSAIAKSLKNSDKEKEMLEKINKDDNKLENILKTFKNDNLSKGVRLWRDKVLTLLSGVSKEEREVALDEVITDGVTLLSEFFIGGFSMTKDTSLETEEKPASKVESAEEAEKSVALEDGEKEPKAEVTETKKTEKSDEVKETEVVGADTKEDKEAITESTPDQTKEIKAETLKAPVVEEPKDEPKVEDTEKSEVKPEVEEKVIDKGLESNVPEFVELLKVQQESMLKIVSSVDTLNKKLESLSQEIETLKEEPSERQLAQATSVDKGLGVEKDGEVKKTSSDLDKDEEAELKDVSKKFANSGILFAEKQKIRQKYNELRAKLG